MHKKVQHFSIIKVVWHVFGEEATSVIFALSLDKLTCVKPKGFWAAYSVRLKRILVSVATIYICY